jgi:hypothetical protein
MAIHRVAYQLPPVFGFGEHVGLVSCYRNCAEDGDYKRAPKANSLEITAVTLCEIAFDTDANDG